MELEHLKLMLREYFSRLPDIAAVYLFGSFAKGRQGPNSDFDVAVLFILSKKQKCSALSAASTLSPLSL